MRKRNFIMFWIWYCCCLIISWNVSINFSANLYKFNFQDNIKNKVVRDYYYFTVTNILTFDLDAKEFLFNVKSNNIVTSQNIDIDWFQLVVVFLNTLKVVYRIRIAGNKLSRSFQSQSNLIKQQYVAQYWFYA